MSDIQTAILKPGTPEVDLCARWRVDAFPVVGASLEQERAALEAFVSKPERQVALVARRGDEPVGTCLLVPSEIEPNHQVTPWLAGLFVVPAHRRCGAGEALVRGIESQARLRGFSRIYLYTTGSERYYARLGWETIAHTDWQGFAATAFMSRTL